MLPPSIKKKAPQLPGRFINLSNQLHPIIYEAQNRDLKVTATISHTNRPQIILLNTTTPINQNFPRLKQIHLPLPTRPTQTPPLQNLRRLPFIMRSQHPLPNPLLPTTPADLMPIQPLHPPRALAPGAFLFLHLTRHRATPHPLRRSAGETAAAARRSSDISLPPKAPAAETAGLHAPATARPGRSAATPARSAETAPRRPAP